MRQAAVLAGILTSFFLAGSSGRPASGREEAERPVTVREGTNFAAAASPDGQTLVLDLQGTLWRLPAAGGEAEALTDGLGDDRLPDFHPDGERVAYQSYRAGTWDIWQISLSEREPEPLTVSVFDDREPAWSPDGTRLAFSSDRGGTYDIWLLEPASGEISPLTRGLGNESQPAWLPDGSGLVFVSVPEGQAEGAVYRIPVPAAGSEGTAVAGTEGMVAAPAVDPNGAFVVFRRLGYQELTLMGSRFDMGSAASWVLAPLEDAAPASAASAGAGRDPGTATGSTTALSPRALPGAGHDLFPFRPQWLDAETLLYTADGRIRRLSLAQPDAGGGPAAEAATVPMEVTLAVRRAPARSGRIRTEAAEPMPVRGLIRPSISPDGTRLLYAALGDIWTAPLDGSEAPLPLTRDTWLDTDPVWLPDGRSVLFASDRGGTMDIWEKQLDSAPGLGLTQLTARLGAEVGPAVAPDGSRIAWLDESGNLRISGRDLAVGPRQAAEPDVLFEGRRGLGMPSWSPNGETIALSVLAPRSSRFREGRNRIALVAAASGETRLLDEPPTSFGSRGSDGPVFSPDGRALAFELEGGLSVLTLGPEGSAAGPPRRVFEGPANFPAWTADGTALTVVSGARLLRVAADGSGSSEIPLRHEFAATEPSGRLLFQDAAVLDVEVGQVNSGLDLLVEGGRIVAITPTGEPPPEDLRVIRTEGATLIPGLIEMHTHPMTPALGNRFGRLHLAYGVTTVRIPAAAPYRMVEEREAILSGRRVGPRFFFTGGTLDGDRIYYPGAVPTPAGPAFEAAFELARELDYDLIKTYVRLDDETQREAIRRAHRMGSFVSSHELYPAVRYGVDGMEHLKGTSRRGFSPKVTDLGHSYEDVRSLIVESGVFFTPTLLIYGGWNLALAREPGLLAADRRIRAFPAWIAERLIGTSPSGADPEQQLALMRPMWETITAVAEAGGRVIAGTDTPIIPYGLGLIIEIEQLAEAGLGAAGAIRAATLTAAEALGLAGELGVIREGALADLVVLEGDPLDDIRNLRRVRAVLWNGRLATLDQLLGF